MDANNPIENLPPSLANRGPSTHGLLQVMQAWRIICHFLLVLTCAVRSNSPDCCLNRFLCDSGLSREIRAYGSTSVRRGLANPGETDFSHGLGRLQTLLS